MLQGIPAVDILCSRAFVNRNIFLVKYIPEYFV